MRNPAFDVADDAASGSANAGDGLDGDSGGDSDGGGLDGDGDSDGGGLDGDGDDGDDSGDDGDGFVDLPRTPTCIPGGPVREADLETDTWLISTSDWPAHGCVAGPGKVFAGDCAELNFGSSDGLAIFDAPEGVSVFVVRFSLAGQLTDPIEAASLIVPLAAPPGFAGATVRAFSTEVDWQAGDKNGQPALDGDGSWRCATIEAQTCTPWPGMSPTATLGPQLGALALAEDPGGFGPAPVRITLDVALIEAEIAAGASALDLMLLADTPDRSLQVFSAENLLNNAPRLRVAYCE